MNIPPKVFISYSWDDDAHKAWVLNLANRLINNGVKVTLDQFELSLGKNLSHFMERAVEEADKVLLILTENYKLKAEGRKGGVGYEYSMINSALYKNQLNNNKFLPILRGEDRDTSTPIFINAFVNLDMRKDSQFEDNFKDLLYAIYEKTKVVKPKLGKMPDFLTQGATLPPPITPAEPTDFLAKKIDHANENHQRKKALQAKKSDIQNLIAKGDTKKALEKAKLLGDELQDKDFISTVILLSGKFAEYAKAKRIGISTSSEQGIALAQVNYGLLGLLSDLG